VHDVCSKFASCLLHRINGKFVFDELTSGEAVMHYRYNGHRLTASAVYVTTLTYASINDHWVRPAYSLTSSSKTSRCLIRQLVASMHMNIRDVHAEALNFVTSWCIDAINRWIKQREETEPRQSSSVQLRRSVRALKIMPSAGTWLYRVCAVDMQWGALVAAANCLQPRSSGELNSTSTTLTVSPAPCVVSSSTLATNST